jgi:serine O-acetyltransferase
MNDFYPIKSKKELELFVNEEKKACFGSDKISLEKKLRNPFKYNLFKLLKFLRTYEYLCYKRDSNKNKVISKLLSFRIKLFDIKKNRLSLKVGVEIRPFCCGKGVRICHPNVIINGYVGDNCIFHGNNVIGNKKTGDKNAVPKIGNNVDIGVGAIVIGDLAVADNCCVGAGAVVTKSFSNPGAVIVGVPAKEINEER